MKLTIVMGGNDGDGGVGSPSARAPTRAALRGYSALAVAEREANDLPSLT